MQVSDMACYCGCLQQPSIRADLQLEKAARIIPDFAAYSPDKQLYAATVVRGSAYSVDVWDATTGERITVMPQNWQPVWSPDGRLLATAGGGPVTVSDGAHGTASQGSGNGSIPGVDMSNTHVMVWQITAPAPVYHVPESVTSVAFSPDSKQFVANGLMSASSERLGHYAIYDTSGRLLEAEIQPDGWPAEKVGVGHGVRIWEQSPDKHEILLHNPGYKDMGLIPRGPQTMVTEVGKPARKIPALGVFLKVAQIVISPDGRRAVIRSNPWTVYPGGGGSSGTNYPTILELWDLDTGNRLAVLRVKNPQRQLDAVAFSADSSRLAILGTNGTPPFDIYLWDAKTGHYLREISDPGINSGLLLFGPDSNTLFAVMPDRFIVFDMQSNRAIRTWPHHGESIGSIAISPDGSYLASGGEDGQLRLWRASDGEPLGAWGVQNEPQRSAITALAFSPTGATLASGAQDGSLRVWNMAGIRSHLSALGLAF